MRRIFLEPNTWIDEPIGGGGAVVIFPGAAIGNPPGVVGEYGYLARTTGIVHYI